MPKKSITDLMLKQIQPTGKRQKIACGDALYLFVEPSHRSKTGSKGFVGITRFPPTKDGKQVETRIGMYGKGFNQWSLSGAREELNRLRTEIS